MKINQTIELHIERACRHFSEFDPLNFYSSLLDYYTGINPGGFFAIVSFDGENSGIRLFGRTRLSIDIQSEVFSRLLQSFEQFSKFSLPSDVNTQITVIPETSGDIVQNNEFHNSDFSVEQLNFISIPAIMAGNVTLFTFFGFNPVQLADSELKILTLYSMLGANLKIISDLKSKSRLVSAEISMLKNISANFENRLRVLFHILNSGPGNSNNQDESIDLTNLKLYIPLLDSTGAALILEKSQPLILSSYGLTSLEEGIILNQFENIKLLGLENLPANLPGRRYPGWVVNRRSQRSNFYLLLYGHSETDLQLSGLILDLAIFWWNRVIQKSLIHFDFVDYCEITADNFISVLRQALGDLLEFLNLSEGSVEFLAKISGMIKLYHTSEIHNFEDFSEKHRRIEIKSKDLSTKNWIFTLPDIERFRNHTGNHKLESTLCRFVDFGNAVIQTADLQKENRQKYLNQYLSSTFEKIYSKSGGEDFFPSARINFCNSVETDGDSNESKYFGQLAESFYFTAGSDEHLFFVSIEPAEPAVIFSLFSLISFGINSILQSTETLNNKIDLIQSNLEYLIQSCGCRVCLLAMEYNKISREISLINRGYKDLFFLTALGNFNRLGKRGTELENHSRESSDLVSTISVGCGDRLLLTLFPKKFQIPDDLLQQNQQRSGVFQEVLRSHARQSSSFNREELKNLTLELSDGLGIDSLLSVEIRFV